MQNLGNLVVLQAFQFLQNDDRAMLRRELFQGRIDLLPNLEALAIYPWTRKR